MQTITPQALITDADNLLKIAGSELNRSSDDAVTHLVCQNSRRSMVNYFTGYLIGKGAHLPHPPTLEGLLERCQSIDDRFRQIDLSDIHCRLETHDKDYCLDVKTVDHCYHIAQQVQALVKS